MANVLNADGTADPKTRHVIMLAKWQKGVVHAIVRWIFTMYTCIDYASPAGLTYRTG
jgi:hypothetical protein